MGKEMEENYWKFDKVDNVYVTFSLYVTFLALIGLWRALLL